MLPEISLEPINSGVAVTAEERAFILNQLKLKKSPRSADKKLTAIPDVKPAAQSTETEQSAQAKNQLSVVA